MSILELFCSVDDFWQRFALTWQGNLLAAGQRLRLRATQMHPGEMMTILILFQQSHYRTFKAYNTEYVQHHLRSEFPRLLSYQRFIELMPTLLEDLGGLVLRLQTAPDYQAAQEDAQSPAFALGQTALAQASHHRVHQ